MPRRRRIAYPLDEETQLILEPDWRTAHLKRGRGRPQASMSRKLTHWALVEHYRVQGLSVYEASLRVAEDLRAEGEGGGTDREAETIRKDWDAVQKVRNPG